MREEVFLKLTEAGAESSMTSLIPENLKCLLSMEN